MTGAWLRPDWRKTGAYTWLVIANIIAATLLLVLANIPTPAVQVFFGILIPLGTILNLLVLQQDRSPQGDSKEPPSAYGPIAYVGVCTTLLVVIAVLPCLTFFRVTCDFEHKLFIGSTQIRLAADIDARAKYLRSHYQAIEIGGDYAEELMAAPEDEHWTLGSVKDTGEVVFSYHEVLGTTINSSEGLSPSLMETILNKITPLFTRSLPKSTIWLKPIRIHASGLPHFPGIK